jgi:lipoprotein-releasing system permease protein
MLVRAKTRDIAILRTMGATALAAQDIRDHRLPDRRAGHGCRADPGLRVPLFPPADRARDRDLTGQNLWDPSIRFLTELPSRSDPVEITVISVMALVFSFLATLYPALQGGEHRSGAGAAL